VEPRSARTSQSQRTLVQVANFSASRGDHAAHCLDYDRLAKLAEKEGAIGD
jgi:hypothetical protein